MLKIGNFTIIVLRNILLV